MSCALLSNLVATWVGVSQCPVRGGWCVPCQTVGGSPGDSVIHSDPHTEQAEKIKLPTRWEFN